MITNKKVIKIVETPTTPTLHNTSLEAIKMSNAKRADGDLFEEFKNENKLTENTCEEQKQQSLKKEENIFAGSQSEDLQTVLSSRSSMKLKLVEDEDGDAVDSSEGVNDTLTLMKEMIVDSKNLEKYGEDSEIFKTTAALKTDDDFDSEDFDDFDIGEYVKKELK